MGDVTTRTIGTVTVNAPTTDDLADLTLHRLDRGYLRDPARMERELAAKLTGMSRGAIDALPYDDLVRIRAEMETLLQSLS